jgi:hypothetical protein
MYDDEGDGPLNTAELREAHKVLITHLAERGVCRVCHKEWACDAYKQARAVFQAHGRPNPMRSDEDD